MVCAHTRVLVRLMLMREEKDERPETDNPGRERGGGKWTQGPVELEVRKLGLEVTDACNSLAHAYIPLGAKCQRTWPGGEGCCGLPQVPESSLFFGGLLFVQLVGFTLTNETPSPPPLKKSPEHIPSHHTF